MRYDRLGYIALNVTNVERSREFYEKIVGLQYSGKAEDGSVFLRCSADHHNIVLCPSTRPGLKRIGIEMEDEAALDELAVKFHAHGAKHVELPASKTASWHQGRTLRLAEHASGATFEFYASMYSYGGQPFMPTVAKIRRIGHVVVKTPRYADTCKAWTDMLELRVSDQIGDNLCFMRFHPNPYHHGIGVGRGDIERLHHVNFMVSEVDDIGQAIARFQREGVVIVNGPGRHPASGSMFLYFLDPDGLTLEYSFGMEEFPVEGARKPRVFEPIPQSYDYWGSFSDPRKSAIGDVELTEGSE